MEPQGEPLQKDHQIRKFQGFQLLERYRLYFATKIFLLLVIILERVFMLVKGDISEILIYFLLQAIGLPLVLIIEYFLNKFMIRKKSSRNLQLFIILMTHLAFFEILVECSMRMTFNFNSGQLDVLKTDLLFLSTVSILVIDSRVFRLMIAIYLVTIFFFRLSDIPQSVYNIAWAIMITINIISAIVLIRVRTPQKNASLPERLQKEFDNYTQGLAIISKTGQVIYMNGNFKGLLDEIDETCALEEVLKLRKFESYSERARRGFLEEIRDPGYNSSPRQKMRPSYKPKEFKLSRGNTIKNYESEKISIVTFKDSIDGLNQRQDSHDRSSYIGLFNPDDNPMTGISKTRTTQPFSKSQTHRLLARKATGKIETEQGLIPHEESIQAMIESIFTNMDYTGPLKIATWDWQEPGSLWLNSLLERGDIAKRYIEDKSSPQESTIYKARVIFRGQTGELKIFEVRLLPFQNSQDGGIFIHIKDVMLEIKLQEALEASEHKERLLRFVSHEFRTPLNCTLSVLGMLKNKISVNLCTLYLEPALNSSKMLLSLVNDLLDFAQIKARKLKISVQPCSLKKIVDEIIDMLKLQASIQNIDVILKWDSDIPRIFYTDPVRVKQILLNLISNAFKFTPQQGSVTIQAIKRTETIVRIEVMDTGRGISTEDKERLFHEFSKVQESSHLNPQGIGLGLVISKLLSQELGPDDRGLIVESDVGKGTTFLFELASKIEEAVKQGFITRTGDLEVSDDDDRDHPEELLQKMKEKYGIIDQATKPPLREDNIKISSYNANSLDQTIKKSKTMDLKLTLQKSEISSKPIRFSTTVKSGTIVSKPHIEIEPIKLSALSQGSYILHKTPKKNARNRIRRPRSIERGRTIGGLGDREEIEKNQNFWDFSRLVYNLNSRCECPKILLVDDDAFNLTAATLLLKSMELTSTSVVDGELAIQAVLNRQNKHSGCKNYSIIFMDVEMPRLNGFETTKVLRRKMLEGEISFIPIIGITGHNPKEKKVDCLMSGMNDIAIKPITPQMLQEIILKWVEDDDEN